MDTTSSAIFSAGDGNTDGSGGGTGGGGSSNGKSPTNR
jgi:hypothetical protein